MAITKPSPVTLSVRARASLSSPASRSQAVSASAKVLPETNRLAVAMETVRAFGDYVRERHPARAMDFIDMIQAFAPELQKRFA